MIHETDLPCSNCGTELVERTVDVRELPPTTGRHGHVVVADCPLCGARHYPAETLSQLADAKTGPLRRGDN